MRIKDLLQKYHTQLTGIYPPPEISAIFYRLTEHFWGLKRLNIALHPDMQIPDNQMEKALTKLQQNKPWQYITGKTEFYGLPIVLNQQVLIPRPETEELVDWILKDLPKNTDPIKIIDIGTGSGAIAISLAKHIPHANVDAIDISAEALKIARKNALLNQVKINFIHTDILQQFDLSDYHIIVSNPPYVRQSEKQQMHPNVVNYEPASALFVADENPLVFYEKIIEWSKNSKQNPFLYFEINEFLKPELEKLLQRKNLPNYTFKKDFFDKWRMLKIHLH